MPKRHGPGRSATRLLSHIEDIVVATSGQDAFELVFALTAARIALRPSPERHRVDRTAAPALRRAMHRVKRAHPELGVIVPDASHDPLLEEVDALLGRALPAGFSGRAGEASALGAVDAVFESLVPRVAKADKGQFFTPRSVVEFVVRALDVRARELVVDPACGSGAFLAHARARAAVKTLGADVDPRAVRVARLAALAQGRDAASIVHGDALKDAVRPAWGKAQVVATNPPFAGRVDGAGFDVARVVRTPERDVLFVERALDLLAPGGRLGIVLPYNKANGAAFRGLRRWLLERARLFAVVGLPRETFLPHTSQRTVVLFAKKRRRTMTPSVDERVWVGLSERAGKDVAGEPILRGGGVVDHDLDAVFDRLAPFLAREGFAA